MNDMDARISQWPNGARLDGQIRAAGELVRSSVGPLGRTPRCDGLKAVEPDADVCRRVRGFRSHAARGSVSVGQSKGSLIERYHDPRPSAMLR
jgi:hypothetical protein